MEVLSRRFLEQLRKTAVFLLVRIDGVPAEIRTGYHFTNLLSPYLWDSTVYINSDSWCSQNRRKSRKHVEDFDPSPRLSVNERYTRLVDPHQRRHSTVIENRQHNCTSHWTRFLTLCTEIQIQHSTWGSPCVTLSPPKLKLTLRRTNPGCQVTVVTKCYGTPSTGGWLHRMEQSSSRFSGTYNIEVVSRFLETLCTPEPLN